MRAHPELTHAAYTPNGSLPTGTTHVAYTEETLLQTMELWWSRCRGLGKSVPGRIALGGQTTAHGQIHERKLSIARCGFSRYFGSVRCVHGSLSDCAIRASGSPPA